MRVSGNLASGASPRLLAAGPPSSRRVHALARAAAPRHGGFLAAAADYSRSRHWLSRRDPTIRKPTAESRRLTCCGRREIWPAARAGIFWRPNRAAGGEFTPLRDVACDSLARHWLAWRDPTIRSVAPSRNNPDMLLQTKAWHQARPANAYAEHPESRADALRAAGNPELSRRDTAEGACPHLCCDRFASVPFAPSGLLPLNAADRGAAPPAKSSRPFGPKKRPEFRRKLGGIGTTTVTVAVWGGDTNSDLLGYALGQWREPESCARRTHLRESLKLGHRCHRRHEVRRRNKEFLRWSVRNDGPLSGLALYR